MTKKPTYEELEQRIRELEEKSLERKQAEDALRESEERLSSFMNSASDSMYLLDSDLNFVEVNKSGSEIIGKKREEVVGKNITDLVPNIKESGRYEQHLEVIKTGQPFEIEDFVPHPIFGDLHFILKSFKVSDGLGVIASDITGRMQAEEALRESEERFSKAFHSNPNSLIISTLTDGRCIDVNEGFLRTFGYSREEVIGRTSSELMLWVDPNDRLKVMQALEQGKRAMLPEVKFRAKSGEIRIMMFAADKIELGGEECLITTANDITERVKAEEDLRKYERTVAASNDHMSLIDRNYVYQVVNDAYLRSHNVKREDIVGHSVPDLFGQEFFETHQKPMIDRCLAGEVARYQSWIDFPTLGRRYMHIAHYPYFEDDGSISGYVVNARDITELKQAEEALRESEERLIAFMESATDGFILFDSELNHIEMNKLALETTGLERKDVIGKNIIDTVPNIKETGRYDEYKKVIKTGVPFYIPDLISHPLTGDKHIELKAFKVGDGLGIIFTDVTERKQAEKEKAKLEAQLQQAQKMEAIGTLAGGIAHDFNNILTPILLYTEMMLEDIPDENTLKFNLKEVYNAVIRSRVLIRQILTFSRQTEPEKASIIIGPIVKEALKLLRSTLPTTIEIRQNIKADVSVVSADPTQIHQILMNLCTNAAYAMREKGGLLEVSLVDVDLTSQDTDHISDLEPGQYVKLVVSDTGTGMKSSVKERILEPYFTTKDKGEGTGLGLAVVHGIVKSYDGAITVDSEPGKGTVFQVFLPLIKRKMPAKSTSATQLPRGNERVLLIDDEMSILKVQQQMLERLGYRVDISESGFAALEVFGSDPDGFDLIITDYTMPDMTGIDLAKAVMNIRDDIPVILCTGFSEHINEEKSKAVGIRAFVMKPIVMNEMAETIRKVLDGDKYALKERL